MSLLISSISYSQAVNGLFADDRFVEAQNKDTSTIMMQCLSPALHPYAITRSDQDNSQQQISVSAQTANIIGSNVADFSGNVDIIHPFARIYAQNARVENQGQNLQANGGITFSSQGLDVTAQSITVDSATQRFAMTDSAYQLFSINGQGNSEKITVIVDEKLALDNVTFSTCPRNDQSWYIKASSIEIEEGQSFGTATNTRIFIGDVPVLYLPYFAFPVTDERQSGLLFPIIDSSGERGVDIATPYYWNIAPNYDLTITPRIMSKRGFMLDTEFRYLIAQNSGQFDVEYLGNDLDLNASQFGEDTSRYFLRWQHAAALSPHWSVNVDFNHLSDANYIVDFGSSFYNRADTSVSRFASVNYLTSNTDFSISFNDFTLLGEQIDNYRALPYINYSHNQSLSDFWQFKWQSEIAYFDNQNADLHSALRYHAQPSIHYNFQNAWSEYIAELTYFVTWYDQDVSENDPLAQNIDRHIGQLRLNGAWVFERPQSLTGDNSIVTLEPQVQYLYTSFDDQAEIGIYDSAPLLNSVDGLFRGRSFTGLDRITDNNQLTVALTSRFLDANQRELVRLGIGQVFYFDDSQVLGRVNSENRSSLLSEASFLLSSRWSVYSQMQLTSNSQKVERSSTTLEYRRDADSLIQFTQRYVRELSEQTINQYGVSMAYPLNDRLQWVGRVFKDRELNRTIETYFGLQYESCCWSVRLIAQRQLLNRSVLSTNNSDKQFDSSIGLQFSFKGLSSTTTNANMLSSGMFGYRQPYFID